MKSERVTIFEVGPRDGLQSLKQTVPTSSKIELINALSLNGLHKIEATSFVNPNWVPQLADGSAVMSGICRASDVTYTALVPNLKGLESALDAQCDEVAVFISASEGFSRANLNCSIDESFERLLPVVQRADNEGIPVRGYLSCIVECPFDGDVEPETVTEFTRRLIDLGCYEVSLGDTIGSATPDKIERLLEQVLKSVPASKVAGHFHDTHNFALSNIKTSLDFGMRVFDSSVAGLGGCPYAPGATGNVNTRAVIEMLHGLGFETGVELDALKLSEAIAFDIKNDAATLQSK